MSISHGTTCFWLTWLRLGWLSPTFDIFYWLKANTLHLSTPKLSQAIDISSYTSGTMTSRINKHEHSLLFTTSSLVLYSHLNSKLASSVQRMIAFELLNDKLNIYVVELWIPRIHWFIGKNNSTTRATTHFHHRAMHSSQNDHSIDLQ